MGKTTVDDYIAGLEGWKAEAASKIRELIAGAAPEADEAIKWSQPVYSFNGPFAYFNAFKHSINIGFWRGVSLSDPDGMLKGSGLTMRHVPIHAVEDIDERTLQAFIRQALQLNKAFGDPTRKNNAL